MIEKGASLSIRRQCELLSVPRRSYYYKPKGESDYNKEIIALIDEQYLRDPTCGSKRITIYLRKKGYRVNRKGEETNEKDGGRAIYQKLKTPIPPKEVPTTENLRIERLNQAWYTEITYVRGPGEFCYAVV